MTTEQVEAARMAFLDLSLDEQLELAEELLNTAKAKAAAQRAEEKDDDVAAAAARPELTRPGLNPRGWER